MAIPYGVPAVWTVRDARRPESEVRALLAPWPVRWDREFFAMDCRDGLQLVTERVHHHHRAEQ